MFHRNIHKYRFKKKSALKFPEFWILKMLFIFLHIILPMLEWSLRCDFATFLYTCIIKISKKMLKVNLNLWFLILKVTLLVSNFSHNCPQNLIQSTIIKVFWSNLVIWILLLIYGHKWTYIWACCNHYGTFLNMQSTVLYAVLVVTFIFKNLMKLVFEIFDHISKFWLFDQIIWVTWY